MLKKKYRINVHGKLVDKETNKAYTCPLSLPQKPCTTWQCHSFTKVEIEGDSVCCCGVTMLGWLVDE